MRRIDQPELRFLVKRGLQNIPKSIVNQIYGSSETRMRALDAATDIIVERLSHLEYEAPDPLEPPVDRSAGAYDR